MYKYENNYTIIHVRIGVIILYEHCGLLYIYTIYDTQNGNEYLNHYNEFEYIQDFVIVF